MSFHLLAPEMLWSLLGLAVPLLLHLLGRGQRRRVPFAAVRWLEPRPALRGLRFAPSDPLLLAARLLLVLLLAIALAQPSWTRRDRVATNPPTHRLDLGAERDLWGALRAADRDLPAGAGIEVVGAARVDALLGSRPLLDRAITWVDDDGPSAAAAAAARPPSSTQPGLPSVALPRRRLRWSVETADASAVATWRGWIEGLAEAMGIGAEEVAPGADSDLVVRIGDPEPATQGSKPGLGGSRILVPARAAPRPVGATAQLEFPLLPLEFELRVEPGALESGQAVARSEQGRPLVAREETEQGEVWRFAFPVTAEATSLPRSPAWIELGWAVLRPLAERRLGWSPPEPDSAVVAPALALPDSPGSAASARRAGRPVWQPWLGVGWAIAALAIVERWLAARRSDP